MPKKPGHQDQLSPERRRDLVGVAPGGGEKREKEGKPSDSMKHRTEHRKMKPKHSGTYCMQFRPTTMAGTSPATKVAVTEEAAPTTTTKIRPLQQIGARTS